MQWFVLLQMLMAPGSLCALRERYLHKDDRLISSDVAEPSLVQCTLIGQHGAAVSFPVEQCSDCAEASSSEQTVKKHFAVAFVTVPERGWCNCFEKGYGKKMQQVARFPIGDDAVAGEACKMISREAVEECWERYSWGLSVSVNAVDGNVTVGGAEHGSDVVLHSQTCPSCEEKDCSSSSLPLQMSRLAKYPQVKAALVRDWPLFFDDLQTSDGSPLSLLAAGMTPSDLDLLQFADFDEGGLGSLNEDALMAAFRPPFVAGQVRYAMQLADIDHSGYVELDELAGFKAALEEFRTSSDENTILASQVKDISDEFVNGGDTIQDNCLSFEDFKKFKDSLRRSLTSKDGIRAGQ